MRCTAQRGLILLGTFALLHLSSKREFGVQLNKPFQRRVTIDLPTFTGNYADYLILVRASLSPSVVFLLRVRF
jgi:hypothetical protein